MELGNPGYKAYIIYDTVNTEILARILFTNSVKRYICDAIKLRLGHVLPLSVNDRVTSAFLKGFIFTNFAYAKFRENKTLEKISEFTVVETFKALIAIITFIALDTMKVSGLPVFRTFHRAPTPLLSLILFTVSDLLSALCALIFKNLKPSFEITIHTFSIHTIMY